MLRRLIFALVLIAAAPAAAQDAGGSSAYAIGGIDVDVSAKSAQEARLAAWRIAQRKAWPMLWARLTGQDASGAPHLSDGQIDGMVAGIESQGEHFSTTRYIARLGVIFDRSRAAEYLGGSGGGVLHSPPMLLLPVFDDGGAKVIYQAKTPWRAAWVRFREGISPIDYVLASGSAGDNLLLTAYQVTRTDRPSWRNILNRFEAVDVLTAEVRLTRQWPGGPVDALFTARHGPDATILGRFSLRADSEAGLDAMLDAGVKRIDDIYVQALRDGRLKSEADLSAELAPLIAAAPDIGSVPTAVSASSGAIEIETATADPAAVNAVEAMLRSTPTVSGVTITSLSLGGASKIVVGYGDSYEMLLYQLDQRGWRIASQGGATVLRRRLAGELALPKPATADVAGAEAVDEPDAAGAIPVPPAGAKPSAKPADPAKDRRKPDPGAPAVTGPIELAPEPPRRARPPKSEPPPPPPPGNAPVDLLPKP